MRHDTGAISQHQRGTHVAAFIVVEVYDMRKSSSLVLAVLFVTVVGAGVLAQTHNNATEKKVADEITFKVDTLVGTHLLKAGTYQVSCNRTTIKFSRITTDVGQGQFTSMSKALEMPCLGKELPARSGNTQMTLPTNKDGVQVLEKLVLRGSSVEHVFPN
jgi:hypothetical protein